MRSLAEHRGRNGEGLGEGRCESSSLVDVFCGVDGCGGRLIASINLRRLGGFNVQVVSEDVHFLPTESLSGGEDFLWDDRKAWRRDSFAGVTWCVEVDKEGGNLVWDSDWGKKELSRWVDAPGWVICWVLARANISRCEDCVAICQHLMNSSEDFVRFRIPTPPCPPAFDDPIVVTEDLYSRMWIDGKDDAYEEFHPNCFCPSDVPASGFPSRKEPPSPPPVPNDHTNPDC